MNNTQELQNIRDLLALAVIDLQDAERLAHCRTIATEDIYPLVQRLNAVIGDKPVEETA